MLFKIYFCIVNWVLLFLYFPVYSQTAAVKDSIVQNFVGSTPCTALVGPLFDMPAGAKCEFMKWRLKLARTAGSSEGNFTLFCEYGLTRPNTTGFTGGTAIRKQGRWKIIKGSRIDPEAIVYQLNPDIPAISISFVKLHENIIHLLYSDQTLMIGNGGWSYTLNRKAD